MSVPADGVWAGKKPPKRLGGMAEALSIASDLGFSIPPVQEDSQGISNSSTGDKSDDLIRVLRELTSVQRNIANLQVELQGRKDDKNVAHLTHVSEMEKKCESLARMTAILKDVIQNKDRIIARLQQPYSLDCIPVEAEYQVLHGWLLVMLATWSLHGRLLAMLVMCVLHGCLQQLGQYSQFGQQKQFSELLLKAASDYGALTASVADFQWSQNFREPPSVWGEMLRPIPSALASCTRFFEAMSAMRDSFATLQQLRVGHSLPMTPSDSTSNSKFATPPQWKDETTSDDSMVGSWRKLEPNNHDAEDSDAGDNINHRRLSWPASMKKGL